MEFPTNIKYTNEHEWIRLEGDTAYVGITDYAQQQLGDIVFIDVTTEGETLDKGEVFGTIEVVKTVSDLFLPIGGEILEVNPQLEEHPELVNPGSLRRRLDYQAETYGCQRTGRFAGRCRLQRDY